MNPSWFSCTNGRRSLALANAVTIGPLLCSKTAIDLRVAGNQRNVEGIIRLAERSRPRPRLPTTSPLQREGPPRLGAKDPLFCNVLPGLFFDQNLWMDTAEDKASGVNWGSCLDCIFKLIF